MKTLKNVLVLALLMIGTTLFAQTNLSGKVVDEFGQPLPGSDVIVEGTNDGAATDFDGNFSLKTNEKAGTFTVSFLGYYPKSMKFNGSKDFGTIALEPSAESLDEVVITGTGVIDLASDRKTPIAVSSISAKEIANKIGNQDLPELLTSTPSVQAAKGAGYGDGSMYLRGFDQTNTAFLLNGQPINGMEDGKMYWSNWSGIMDIANAVQVQRGLGSSKLAISSVGGTVNIVTKTVDNKEGGFVQGLMGNDNYYKGSAYYSTGLMENGLAVGVMLGHWQGDGYRNGTAGQGQTYYLSFGYKPNENHIFNFLVTGAPQWHGSAWNTYLDTYLHDDAGRRYNDLYGFENGEERPGLRNFYHKPVINLSWDWSLSDSSSLSTVLYGSLGRGGYAIPRGFWTNGEDGGLDFDAVIAENTASETGEATAGYMRSSYNGHNWYGLVTNYEKEVNDNITVNFGGDVRMYHGLHFKAATEMFGADYVNAESTYNGVYKVDNIFGGYNPWEAVSNWNNDKGQHLDRDYEEDITYYGVFTQAEYAKDAFSAFIQGAVSNQSHAATNYFAYETATESEVISNLGYNVKGGLAYELNDHHKLFGNAGYYSRQPFHDNIYPNLTYSVDTNKSGFDNETVLGLELGYGLKVDRFNMNVNLYQTTWGNRIISASDSRIVDGVEEPIYFQINGVEQTHKGFELDFSYRAIDNLKIKGFTSIGDWTYNGQPTALVFDDENNDITSEYTEDSPVLYLNDVKVGGAAQFTAGLGMDWTVAKNLKLNLSQRYYDKMYSNINPRSFNTEDNEGALRLPSFSLTDIGVSYKLPLEKNSIDFRVNVNNLFDEFYIEYSKDAKHLKTQDDFTTAAPTDDDPEATVPDVNSYNEYIKNNTWRGVDTSNKVSIGYGRTWNASVRFNF